MPSECDELAKQLAEILSSIPHEKCAISFSGGLDSSVIAYLFRDGNVSLYTVGFQESQDIRNARLSAKLLGLPLNEIILTDSELAGAIRELLNIAGPMSAVEISFELPLYFTAMHVDDAICTGQGADELFGGYAKYLQRPELMPEDLRALLNITAPRENRIVKHFGHNLKTPYLSPEMVKFAGEVPVNCKIKNGVRKWILREAARIIGVPEEIATRKKKAAQYGSGIWKSMQRQARKRGFTVEEWIRRIERD